MYMNGRFERLSKRSEDYQKQKEEEMKGKKYTTANGVEIACLQCQNQFFYKGKTLLNKRGTTFLGLDWLDEAAITLVCNACGFIHWFANDVKQI